MFWTLKNDSDMKPKPIINEFCCLSPLRSGCIIISLFLFVTSTMFLFGYVTRRMADPNDEKRNEEYLLHEGKGISFVTCGFNYVISVLLFAGVCLEISIVVISTVVIFVIYTVFQILCAAYTAFLNEYVASCALLIYAAVIAYFTITVYSYYADKKLEDEFWAMVDEELRAELKEQRERAKEQGLPDPLKAAIKKYRAPVEGEDTQVKQTSSQTSVKSLEKNKK